MRSQGESGEFVDGGDDERGHEPVDLLVHHQHRQSFAVAEVFPEGSLQVGTEDPSATFVALGFDVFAGFDGRSAPRAAGELVRGAVAASTPVGTLVPDPVPGLAEGVGGDSATDPQAQPEGHHTPTGLVVSAFHLTGADGWSWRGRRPLRRRCRPRSRWRSPLSRTRRGVLLVGFDDGPVGGEPAEDVAIGDPFGGGELLVFVAADRSVEAADDELFEFGSDVAGEGVCNTVWSAMTQGQSPVLTWCLLFLAKLWTFWNL